MAISPRLQELLRASKVKYTIMKHPVVYTAQEIAAAQHVPGRQLAKCVLVLTDRGPFLAVLPATHLIDMKKLRAVVRAKRLTIAKESDIKATFPDVEVGAMSPFGGLYQVPVAVDRLLASADEIVFNAGSHTETIKMRYQDVVTLVKPAFGAFGQPISSPSTARKASAKSKKSTLSKRAVAKSASRRPPRRQTVAQQTSSKPRK